MFSTLCAVSLVMTPTPCVTRVGRAYFGGIARPVSMLASSCPGEVWIASASRSCDGRTTGECLKSGDAAVLLPDVVSKVDCQTLIQASLHATEAARTRVRGADEPAPTGMIRLVPETEMPASIHAICDGILHNVLSRLDAEVPSVAEAHLDADDATGACPGLAELHAAGGLKFHWREPAIIVYTVPEGGLGYAQKPHRDGEDLTMLVPLSTPEDDFSGGGTGFWARDTEHSGPNHAASTVLRPDAGSAIVFGGFGAVHAGLPLESGIRVVFVASFGPAPKLTAAQIAFRNGS